MTRHSELTIHCSENLMMLMLMALSACLTSRSDWNDYYCRNNYSVAQLSLSSQRFAQKIDKDIPPRIIQIRNEKKIATAEGRQLVSLLFFLKELVVVVPAVAFVARDVFDGNLRQSLRQS